LEAVPKGQVRQEFQTASAEGELSAFDEYRLESFNKWHRPIAWESEFAPWIRSIALPLNWLSDLDADQQHALLRHPGAVLPEALDRGRVRIVGQYNEEVRRQVPWTVAPADTFVQVAKRCLVSAVERYAKLATIDRSLAMQITETDGTPSRTDWAMHRSYTANGLLGVSETDIRTMIHDYYLMLGSLVPDFASYQES
jgi:hypothetical protein